MPLSPAPMPVSPAGSRRSSAFGSASGSHQSPARPPGSGGASGWARSPGPTERPLPAVSPRPAPANRPAAATGAAAAARQPSPHTTAAKRSAETSTRAHKKPRTEPTCDKFSDEESEAVQSDDDKEEEDDEQEEKDDEAAAEQGGGAASSSAAQPKNKKSKVAPGEKDLATQFQDAFVSTLGALQGNQSYHFTRKASQQQDGDFAAAEWPMLSDFFNLHFGCKLKPVTFFNLLHESGHKLVRKTYRTDTKFLIDGKHVGRMNYVRGVAVAE